MSIYSFKTLDYQTIGQLLVEFRDFRYVGGKWGEKVG